MDDREENQFIVDDVSKVIKEAIEQTIGGNSYQHDKVNNWTGTVVENCLSVLTKQQKPYKYIGKMVLGCIQLAPAIGTMIPMGAAPFVGRTSLCTVFAVCLVSQFKRLKS